MTWAEHALEWQHCERCPLGAHAQNHVLVRWSMTLNGQQRRRLRDWLFIGEAPGPSEDALGIAFAPSAPAGSVLECLLDDLEISNFCISNVIACFPLDWQDLKDYNRRSFRAPTKEEAEACSPRIAQLIDIVNPRAAVLMGAEAKRYCAEELDRNHVPHCEIPHPSFIGRNDGYTSDWEKRRRENVVYKRAKDTIQLFMETL